MTSFKLLIVQTVIKKVLIVQTCMFWLRSLETLDIKSCMFWLRLLETLDIKSCTFYIFRICAVHQAERALTWPPCFYARPSAMIFPNLLMDWWTENSADLWLAHKPPLSFLTPASVQKNTQLIFEFQTIIPIQQHNLPFRFTKKQIDISDLNNNIREHGRRYQSISSFVFVCIVNNLGGVACSHFWTF